jgi:hypothetical protein
MLVAQRAKAQYDLIGVQWSFTNSLVVAINSTNGQSVPVGLSGVTSLNSLARNSAGVLFSAGVGNAGVQLVTVDPSTGVATAGPTLNFGADTPNVRALAFSSNDILYCINSGTSEPDNLYTIDPQTGRATLVGNTGLGGIQSLDFSPQGLLYGWDVAPDSETPGAGLVLINPNTGVATDVNPLINEHAGDVGIQSIVFALDGTLYGAGDALLKIDVTTGAATLIGYGGYSDLRGIEVMPPPPLSIRSSEVEACWPSISNQLYRVEYRSELTTNMWKFLLDVQATNRTTCITDKIPVGQPQRFYRLVPNQRDR